MDEWQENKAAASDAPRICPECGTELEAAYAFCPACGKQIGRICPGCGRKADMDMRFCGGCGRMLADAPVETKGNPTSIAGRKRLKWIGISGGAVVAVVVILCLLLTMNRKSPFQKAYEAAGGANFCGLWVTVYQDGSGLRIDTNPRDIEGYYDSDALESIRKIHASLGLPESILDKMTSTRALDGRQTQRHNGIAISWTYHPDAGLEIIYEEE